VDLGIVVRRGFEECPGRDPHEEFLPQTESPIPDRFVDGDAEVRLNQQGPGVIVAVTEATDEPRDLGLVGNRHLARGDDEISDRDGPDLEW